VAKEGGKKGCPVNVSLMINYIASWAKTREMKPRDLNGVWCIEDEEQRVLVKVEHIKERWNSYFNRNDIKDMKDWSNMGNPMEDRNRRFV